MVSMNRPTKIALGTIAAAVVISVVVSFSVGLEDQAPPASDMQLPPDPDIQMPSESDMQMSGQDRIVVFASFYPYYEFARNVAGDRADVSQYLPSGVEAHDWEPRAQEIQSLKEADVFVYNGLGMESYVEGLIDSGEFPDVVFVKASDGLDLLEPTEHMEESSESDEHMEELSSDIHGIIEEFEHGHLDESQAMAGIDEILHEHEGDGHDHGHALEDIEEILHDFEDGQLGASDALDEISHLLDDDHGDEHGDDHGHHHDHDWEFDPHVWLDPVLAKQQVNNIRDGLISADPQNREHYEQNAMLYNEELDALDADIRSSLSSCSRDTFVPFHNAFTYLGERYGLKMMALGGLAPDAEASAAEIAELVDFMRDNDINVIFAEELVDPRLAEVIADEAGARVMLLSPMEALTAEEAEQGVTYVQKMGKNIDALNTALDCQ